MEASWTVFFLLEKRGRWSIRCNLNEKVRAQFFGATMIITYKVVVGRARVCLAQKKKGKKE